jgi:hypothetical protein
MRFQSFRIQKIAYCYDFNLKPHDPLLVLTEHEDTQALLLYSGTTVTSHGTTLALAPPAPGY